MAYCYVPSPTTAFFKERKPRLRERLAQGQAAGEDRSHGPLDLVLGLILSQHSWPNIGKGLAGEHGDTCQGSVPPAPLPPSS